jgi:hypothetical protein
MQCAALVCKALRPCILPDMDFTAKPWLKSLMSINRIFRILFRKLAIPAYSNAYLNYSGHLNIRVDSDDWKYSNRGGFSDFRFASIEILPLAILIQCPKSAIALDE